MCRLLYLWQITGDKIMQVYFGKERVYIGEIFPDSTDCYQLFNIKEIFWDDTAFINHRKGRFMVVGNVVSSPQSQKEKKS